MAEKRSAAPRMTLHRLMSKLTYMGASARLLLVAMIAAAMYVALVLESILSGFNTSLAAASGLLAFVYILGTFFTLEAGYLLIARKYRLPERRDKQLLFGTEIILALLYFGPYFFVAPAAFVFVTRGVFLPALAVLAFRLLVGLLYGRTAK